MAGTLHSVSSCPCRARFVPSMLEDSYEKGGQSSESTFSFDTLFAALRKPYGNEFDGKHKNKSACAHTDGAIQVAQYILSEIKTNVRSPTAELIRNFIDSDTLKVQYDEWMTLPFYKRLGDPPEANLPAAIPIWYQAVKTGGVWDHKPKIRDKFSSVAVARPLPVSGTPSKSYFHKFKRHDYFYDVWSNIHYGYVGLSVGFSESLLLKGSGWEQQMTPGAVGDDTLDDIISMKIGFKLFKLHGKYAERLTCNDILNALEVIPDRLLPNSRSQHWCWNMGNPERTE